MNHLIPSHRTRPADDPIFALHQEAKLRRGRGENLVDATLGTLLDESGELAILPSAVRALKDVTSQQWAGYAPIAGTSDFLEAVCSDLLGAQSELRNAATAVATPGGTGALHVAIVNYLEVGQSLLTTEYFWNPYAILADEADRKCATFSMFDQHGGLDIGALDRSVESHLISQGRVLLILNDPCHNPTGYSMTGGEWRAVTQCLLARARQGAITLLVDCAYLAYGSAESRAFLSELPPLLGKVNLLFAWSSSKSFTHYGLRVGALIACVADDRDRAAVAAAFTYSCRGTWSNCNHGGISTITRILTDGALREECDRDRALLKGLLDARVATFNRLAKPAGLRYPRYTGGFFVTVFVNDPWEKAARMRARSVFVVPLSGAVRVALASVAERDVARVVEALT